MAKKNSSFDGSRLREAREARDCSVLFLAEAIGRSQQAVYKYEQNESSPAPAVLEAIAKTLNMPVPFFTQPARSEKQKTVFYRSMSTSTKHARNRAKRQLDWLEDVAGYLQSFVQLPEVDLPSLSLSQDPLLIDSDDIEVAARETRMCWGMSEDAPIGNMVAVVENHGVVVARHSLGAVTLDSVSEIEPMTGRPYMIIGTDKGSAARWRFDVAHELGHLLLHPGIGQQQLMRAELHKLMEEQAHQFALAFLLPLQPFSDDLIAPNLDVLRGMKPKWKVSIAAMIMRARNLELYSPQSIKNLWINMSRRGWRISEPFDDELIPEEPRLLRRAVQMTIEAKLRAPDDVLAELNLPARDIESLANLPIGFFNSDFTPVQLLTTQDNAGERRNNNRPGIVIPLNSTSEQPKSVES